MTNHFTIHSDGVATNKLDSLDGASSSERVRFSCNSQCKQPCQPYSSANTSLSHDQATPLHEWIKKEIKEECDDCTSGDILSPEGVRYNGVTLCVEKETYADVDQRNALSTSSQTEQPDNALNELPDGSVELESQNINAHERQSDVAATCFVQQSNNLTLSKVTKKRRRGGNDITVREASAPSVSEACERGIPRMPTCPALAWNLWFSWES
ncbi:unnamed protein product [Toxocara canis]|uniref:Uncharacterized protein n=1 Tax=Toxocara canis TaxID=6265 RepID=A0A183VGR3_TOXCA|nr:unnamed protein product [Toxocara canis]